MHYQGKYRRINDCGENYLFYWHDKFKYKL